LDRERQAAKQVVAQLLEGPRGGVEGYLLHPQVHSLGVEQAVGDRQPHVRERRVQDDRAIFEEDTSVDHRLAVHRHPHGVIGHAEEVVRLYDLEPLVHHRSRVYRDLSPHPPRGMLERVARPDLQ